MGSYGKTEVREPSRTAFLLQGATEKYLMVPGRDEGILFLTPLCFICNLYLSRVYTEESRRKLPALQLTPL